MAEQKAIISGEKVATIRQVSVEINTLRVSNKQVTQSVFRQIPEVPIAYLFTATLEGSDAIIKPSPYLKRSKIWGIVRYDFDRYKCVHQESAHVVFQGRGDILYRAWAYKSYWVSSGYGKKWIYPDIIINNALPRKDRDDISRHIYGDLFYDFLRGYDIFIEDLLSDHPQLFIAV